MQHAIDPKIDCVFKALLGSESNQALLIHFLNAILGEELNTPITEVDILNPYNEREFISDKLSIVDVKARDASGCLYQVEIQLLTRRDLLVRIFYSWADLYSGQLKSGEEYNLLKPTYSIWLLGEELLRGAPEYAHSFCWRDRNGWSCFNAGGIWLLELNKFNLDQINNEQQRWLKFFKDGEQLDTELLPSWMETTEMRQAMTTLKTFSEKEHAYHAYQARQNYLRVQRGIEREFEELRTGKAQAEAALKQSQATAEQERLAKEAALQREAAALAELALLKAQLSNAAPKE
jgi:predicted transposase/invertase (TIGR01784 family)